MIYHITQGIQQIFYNNYKWNITFKNCESLYYTPVTYIVLYIKFTSIGKKKKNSDSRSFDPQFSLLLAQLVKNPATMQETWV